MQHTTRANRAIPSLIYGTAWKKEKTAELVEKAILCGFRGIDTACQPKHYHEAGVGLALQRLEKQGIARDSLFLQTKFTPLSGQDPSSIPYNPADPLDQQVRSSFAMSLQNLKVDFIDSLLLHSPLLHREQTMQVWRAMEELHLKGSVGRLGISNCYLLSDLKSIYEAAAIKPTIIQNRFYSDTNYDHQIRKWCFEKSIYYQSFWTLTANPQILKSPLMRSVAAERGVTEAQVFFRFLTQRHIIPLIGSCSEKHMREDLAIFDFALNASEIQAINLLLT